MAGTSVGRTIMPVFAIVLTMSSCGGIGSVDGTSASPISNDAVYATLGYLWGGVRSAIEREREPSVSPFTLPLSYKLPCVRGGTGSYAGSLTGTKSAGTGTGTLAMTASLAECQFDDGKTITRISATGVSITGTIAIVNDSWGAISMKMTATSVTINGVSCPGGVDVMITGGSPSAQPISTGTACGRTGAVALP